MAVLRRFGAAFLRLFLAVVLFGVGAPTAAGGELATGTLERAVDSAVFIRVNRVFRGMHFPSSGSGFFVSPDGYVLTNWHVVSDQIMAEIYGDEREISTKVLSLEVVVGSGTGHARVHKAVVVARDRDRDLVLLKIKHAPRAWLDISSPSKIQLTERVWIVGYPLGELVAVAREKSDEVEVDPEVSVNGGMVTSLRRDGNGVLKAIQIDAAVNPGNSGGAMVNSEGEVVGVVNSMIMGAQGLGFAISGNVLRDFATRKAVKIGFEPSVVMTPATPIEVTVKPILADLEASSGRVVFSGEDISPVTRPLVRDGDEWKATLEVPEPGDGRQRAESYVAEIRFDGAGEKDLLVRRFRIRTYNPQAVPTLGGSRDSKAMIRDRQAFSNEMSISDYTKSGEVTGRKTKSLSDVAGGIKLERSKSGSIVIDNSSVMEISNPLEYTFPDTRYRHLAAHNHKVAAAEYDVTRYALGELRRSIPVLEGFLSDPDREVREKAGNWLTEYRRLVIELEPKLEVCTKKLVQLDLVLCIERDDEAWYFRHSVPCDRPIEP